MAQALGIQDQRLLDGTEQTLYTVLAAQTYVAKTIVLCNVSANTIPSINVWILPNGVSTTADQYKIVSGKAIVTTETIFINPDIYLQAGYKIVVKASAGSVIASTLSGVVIS